MNTINAECGSCKGTGLYCGFVEPKGTAVICVNCGGSGMKEIKYTPFTGRKHRDGIHTVSRSRGSLLALGVGAVGQSMSYAQFQKAVK
jgi:hypothetical protein